MQIIAALCDYYVVGEEVEYFGARYWVVEIDEPNQAAILERIDDD